MVFSWVRVALWIAGLVAGAVYGTAGTIMHSYRLGPVPVGLIVSVIGVAALLLAARLLTGDRWTALAVGVGAFGMNVLLSGKGPGGSVLVPGGGLDEIAGVNLGIVFTAALALVATLIVAWPHVAGARRDTRP